MIHQIFGTMTAAGRKMFVAAVAGFALYSMVSIAMVLLTVAAILDVINDSGHLWMYAIALVMLLLVKTTSGIWADKQKHCAGFDLVFQIRKQVIRHLKKLPLGYYTQSRLGEISEIIHRDVDNMELIVAHLWTRLSADILVSVLLLSGLLMYSWPLALLMICTLPLAVLYLVLALKYAQPLEKATGDAGADMASLFVEYVRGMPVIKAFSQSHALDDRVHDSIERFAHASGKAAKNRAATLAIYGWIMNLSLVAVITGGLLMVLYGTVSAVVFLVFIVVSAEFYKPFVALEGHWMNYLTCVDSYRRITTVTQAPILSEPKQPRIPQGADIAFEHVTFRYAQADAPALIDASLRIPTGTTTALVGPSGAGKTTATSLLMRFWDVESGQIRIGGVDLRDIGSEGVLAQISVVMQNVYLFADTIANNISLGKKDASREEIMAAAKAALIHDDIMALPKGYNTRIGENGVGLSGGQRQRLSVARAFLKDAPIVVLDEITANVDPINEALMQRAVTELTVGRTVIVIAHHLHTIQSADQIVVFDAGRIIETGTHTQLCALPDGYYRRMWEQCEGLV
ncbi:ABC transporter ATP-binding protein [Actinomyces trachealis]|uniref:ABC transporter ATP-binding protein n=1 Tax=Actinomyces trachealis TaxID=2763540 RepID=UPI0018C5A942|nr:ABC transporter ATP-binding protein [Actinomyces trachealis]